MGNIFSFLEYQRDENISLKALDKKRDEEREIMYCRKYLIRQKLMRDPKSIEDRIIDIIYNVNELEKEIILLKNKLNN
jgi:hypothetical protein